ncbi:ribosomal protein S5 domain 2-type protein [Rhodocollybia butyracea]|uniref:Phosphomevalonate kinase n=1 Tax=Rhodocollybia butyracea TaxID=206335 RepID=A0A9P5PSZ9_9AGAR|nr:ribosomal protein S5 domain 2-type protein [Rhodocollybia butyracea]
MSQATVVSAPGKVLIAGGYLVLDPAYSGVVVSTSSRFYTVIQQSSRGPNTIQVRSPQFDGSTWIYSLDFSDSPTVQALEENTSKNKFVHLALQHTISLACEVRGISAIQQLFAPGLDIAIVGDNDFYSQRAQLATLNLPRTLSSLSSIQPFCPQGVTLSQVHKTGLGSSAALITSLVSALLLRLEVIPPSALSEDHGRDRHLAHNLSQFIHCLAQGKVGSGFDVFRGSPLMGDDSTRPTSILPVVSPANSSWNHLVRPFQLPPLTRLMLADVDAGSDTPSLVGKVLAWRKNDPENANTVWTALDQLNQSLNPKSYTAIVKFISSLQPVQWTADPSFGNDEAEIAATFYHAHAISQEIRMKMKMMGELAGVPIEPHEQTELLNECCSLAGVIGGGVPGAGGYDAVWLLVCEPEDCQPGQWPRERIEYVWSNYTKLDVSPLSAEESLAKGARLESIDAIKGLRQAMQIL